MALAWPGRPGITPTCRGTALSCGWARSSPTARSATGGSLPVVRRSRSSSPSGRPTAACYFVSDRQGWWNLYRWRGGEVEALCPLPGGVRRAAMGLRRVDLRIRISRAPHMHVPRGGAPGSLATLGYGVAGSLSLIDLPYTEIGGVTRGAGPSSAQCRIGQRAGVARAARAGDGQDDDPPAFIRATRSTARTSRFPKTIEFPTGNGLTAHALYYRPRNPDFTAPSGELPPLLVISHGGPTAPPAPAFNLGIQYWTSRGFAVLDVNYGGSTGYGRAYRERLNGQWGVVDVDDCVNGARYLVDAGTGRSQSAWPSAAAAQAATRRSAR